ncbi:ligase-associated DNA damage response endonuclease PdeM [Mongoliimonas terrestris]|uniref:ligase-associated DNA damage response endonuclease PdeM n=1 Tax=Mongoliimonas terrestris TaxID=1709001 RepID=UPI000A7B4770|nr:ligase-associated DNA damage response endonuclease PdeM [Mongoliimonas terrestris]
MTALLAEDLPVLTRDGLVRLAGAAVRLDASGALFWPAEETLVVADLHLEKGSSAATRGHFLPPYDTRATVTALEAVVRRLAPRRVIALGDSFHDRTAEGRLMAGDGERIRALTRSADWLWVTGNHDPEPPKLLGGSACDLVAIGPVVFRHEPSVGGEPGEVAGHLHPCARVGVRGRSLRRRAFATDGERCILPAFGAYTGGLNVLDRAYLGLFERSRLIAWMIGEERVYPVRGASLLPD